MKKKVTFYMDNGVKIEFIIDSQELNEFDIERIKRSEFYIGCEFKKETHINMKKVNFIVIEEVE